MDTERPITGNLINAYYICHRKLWLFAHEISPSLENPYLEIGSLIGEETYKREKKEILFGNIKIDLIKKEGGNIIVAEIKKSSKGINAAKMQLLFYLYKLKEREIVAKGELLIPKERKKISIELDEAAEERLENDLINIKSILKSEDALVPEKIPFCKKCSYFEFCWS